MTSLPEDWRHRLVQMIIDAEPPDPATAQAWFRGGTGLDAAQQIGVYREQYALRLGGAVQSAFPALEHLVGNEFGTLVLEYLLDNPSHTWTLDRVGNALPDWLARTGAQRDRIQAAAVDAAVHHAVTAGDGAAPDSAALGPETRLAHAPSLTVLHLGAAWHTYRAGVVAGTDPIPPPPQSVTVAIYRVGPEVRHRELDAVEAEVLGAFRGGATLIQAVEQVVAAGADVAVLQASLQIWFARFAERRLLVLSPAG